MSSRISAKASDAKATVSFNSDSEDDDDNSASSPLSSSDEDDVSDVETVTFSVSLAPKNKGETAASACAANGQQLQQEPGRGSTRAADKGTASPKSRLSPNKVEVAEVAEKTAAAEFLDLGLKKSTKSSMEDAGDELNVTKTKIANTGRARSPKITINDVDSVEAESDAATGGEKASKKTRGSSPRKIASNESNEDFNSYSASASRSATERARSPQKSASDDEVEFSRPIKKSSKVISDLDFDETAPEEPLKHKSSKSSRFGSGDRHAERARSPKKSSEERELPRAKSPKKSSGEIDENRAKSPKKKTSEDKDFLRETSPRNSSKEGKRKSSKGPGKALDELIRSTESPENSPTGNTRLEVNQDLDDAKEPSTKVKKTKKTKHSKHEDGKVKEERPAKVTADKTDGEISSGKTGERLHRKELLKTEDLGLFYGSNLAEDDGKDRRLNFSKYGLNSAERSESESGKLRLDDELEVSREIAKYKRSELSKSPEVGDDVAIGKTMGVTLEGKAPMIAEVTWNESPSRDSNHLKVDAAAENAKELVNEDSDFTYRRKSMDDFIKRILAEAREEKLKQKQILKNEPTVETDRRPDVQREILGKPPRWNSNAAADKDKSNLDKRLASIEKRRFGGNESKIGESSKDKYDDGKRESVQNGINDLDMNLDEDLEEINRFLQSRKSAASRFDDYDDGETTTTTTNDHSSAPTVAKQRTSVADEGAEQTVVTTEAVTKPDEGPVSSGTKPKTHKAMKKYGVDLNLDDDDDDGRFLARFKRERDAMLSETLFSPRRRDETDEVVRERTRNVRVLVDQQVDIIQSMRNTSKSLDELEKEIREARQVCLDRQIRIEALEGALGAEFRTYENGSQTAGSEGSLKDELGRLRRQTKFGGESADDDGSWFRRRSGSVASVGSFGSAFGGGGGSDLSELVRPPPSGYRQQRGPDLRRAEFEAEFQDIDRRRAASVNRDHRAFDVNPFSPPDDTARLMLNQRPARSRASIATSSPTTLDLTSGDGFLAKIRAKYSFLAPSIDSSGYLGGSSGRNQSASSYGTAGLQSSLDLKYSRTRSSFDDAKLRTTDFFTSPSPSYTATGSYTPTPSHTHTPSYYSVRDSRSPAGGGGAGGFAATGGASWDRTRRAQSVSEFSFDRPSVASGSGGGGGEFHSRFLDKVREKKASMGDEQTTATPKGQGQGQDKPFKSRFLRTSSFDSTGSRSDRVTNGEGSEVTVDA